MTRPASPGGVQLRIVNRATQEVESVIDISAGEAAMPGYVDHVIRGYEGTRWYAERSEDGQDASDE